ncbi:MAG: VCBS repeat-containing protein [Bacteroidota bacterium]
MLVKATSLSYEQLQQYAGIEIQGLSLLNKVEITGYRKYGADNFTYQKMPALQFSYSLFNAPQSPVFKTLSMGNETIPGYLDTADFLPVDLNGDGLPGFLFSNDQSTFYLEPKGGGNYSFPQSLPSFPVNRDIQDGEFSLRDIDGNGQLDLVVSAPAEAGYYQNNNNGGWENFQPFRNYPIDIANRGMETASLNANGKTDLLLAGKEDIVINYGEGESGYGPGKRVLNENGFPLIKEDYNRELVTFADMFGDGLAHRVRITNGSVECWPCLGYGRFGKKVIFDNAPVFQEHFNNKRLYLADITGSGTSDLVYIYGDRVELFLNQNGNSFSSPVRINLPDMLTDIDQISFSDISGNGTACLVFSKMTPVPVHYYYNFAGEITDAKGHKRDSLKPFLLNEINNNTGRITSIDYCSSTKFSLEDKLAGGPG